MPTRSGAPVHARLEGGQWKRVMCKLCGNNTWCTAQAYVKDGVVLSIAGDEENPLSAGKLCSRGQAAMMTTYNPYRVQAPMKRTNPKKGLDEDPGWVEISWDEALDTVAGKMKETRQKDPRRFAHLSGFGGWGSVVTGESLVSAYGSPYDIHGNGHLCPVHIGCSFVNGAFLDKEDIEYCNYFVSVGGSLGPNQGSPWSMRAVTKALERGMKLVVVDPRMSPEAAMAHEWVPIRPGSDLAFTLGVLHVLLHETPLPELDVRFIKERTNLPYLIGDDKLYVEDPSTGRPLVWDLGEGRAKTFADPSVKEYALEGEYQMHGRRARPAFACLKEEMAAYSPEWQEQHTTVPAETVRRVTREFVAAAQVGATITLDGFEFPLRPAILRSVRGGYSTTHGAYQHFAVKIVTGLVGACDVPGSFLGADPGPALSPGPDGVVAPKSEAVPAPWQYPPSLDLREFYPHRHSAPYLVWKAVLHPEKYGVDHDLDTVLVFGTNPVHTSCTPAHAIEAFKKIPFMAVIALVYDEMTQFADILLPESTLLERYNLLEYGAWIDQAVDKAGIRTPSRTVMVSKPVIDPIWNTRQADDIYLELAERAGFLYGEGGLNDRLNVALSLTGEHKLGLDTRYTPLDLIDRITRCHFGDEHSLPYFDEHAVIGDLLPEKEGYNFYYFPWGTTRHPLYFEQFYRNGLQLKENLTAAGLDAPPGWDAAEFWEHWEPIPRWVGRCDEAYADEFDLRAMVWSTPQTRCCSGDQIGNPWIREMVQLFDPYDYAILMNRETAEKKGLAEGDEVEVEAFWGGSTRGVLKVTELLHPDALGFPGHHGFTGMHRNPITLQGPNFNNLLSDREGEFSPIHCATDISPRVRVTRIAPSARSARGKGGGH